MASITFKGNPVSLSGNEVKAGDKAPGFTVLANDLSEVSLNDFKGAVRLISVVPSVDTGVCAAQTKRFNEELAKLGNVTVLTISADLPFAQKRWAAENGLDDAKIYSDHRDLSFGNAYGVIMPELRLLARSVFVIDSNDEVTYVEYVSEGTNHPDYDAALEAARQAK
ncbi:MAG TPA: thiol peroxidase [Bacillaceae bacterium]